MISAEEITMAEIVFTTHEQDRINALLGELDPDGHELLRPFTISSPRKTGSSSVTTYG